MTVDDTDFCPQPVPQKQQTGHSVQTERGRECQTQKSHGQIVKNGISFEEFVQIVIMSILSVAALHFDEAHIIDEPIQTH